jgi:hypothetical protein
LVSSNSNVDQPKGDGLPPLIQISRRHFLWTAAAAIVTARHSDIIRPAHAVESARRFDARNAMRFHSLPDLSRLGLRDVRVVYTGELWPKGASKSEPDLKFIETTTIPRVRKGAPDLVVIDIEHWDLAGIALSELERNINRYVAVLDTVRRHLPMTRLGLYSMAPVRNYWTPVRGKPDDLSTWQRDNERLQPIADASDVIFPSLYTFYDDPAGWVTYATANMLEAKRYGRPIYPFIWPQYHDSGELIAGDFWRLQLETVFNNADGMVIWTPAKGKPRWNPDAAWWRETADFLKTAGLASSTGQ